MVHRYVLDRIADPRLKAYVVWGPFKERETVADARFASAFVTDPRATQFWTETTAPGDLFREPLGLGPVPAWDSFLVYDADARWGEMPPKPASFMRRSDESRPLNGATLHDRVRALLDAARPDAPRPPGSR